MKATFDTFLADENIRNLWVYEKFIAIYVRRGNHTINGKIRECLDLASVEVSERHRSKGIFTKFLKRFEEAAQVMDRVVYVECIHEPRLVEFLAKKGYTLIPSDFTPTMFKILS